MELKVRSTGGNLSQYKSDEEHVTRELKDSKGWTFYYYGAEWT